MSVSVFCPGHISGYFLPVLTQDPDASGSCGAGIVPDRGVTVTVSHADTYTFLGRQYHHDGTIISRLDSSYIIEDLVHEMGVIAFVCSETDLPLLSGYGLSAAALLATAHGINRLFHLGLSDDACARYAHRIEIKHKTGLGDVAACRGGGWVCRRKPGINSDIIRTYDNGEIAVLTLGPMTTADVLSDSHLEERLRRAVPDKCPQTCQELFSASRHFAEKSGFLSDHLKDIIISCSESGIESSMTMLGDGVFAYGQGAAAFLSQWGEVHCMHISKTGPVIISDDTGDV